MTSPTLARLQGNNNNDNDDYDDNDDNHDNHDDVGNDNDENDDDLIKLIFTCCPQEPDQECRFEGRGRYWNIMN